jgi:NTP pyrophosphatase (non-canonical NTP hydrolase)
MIPTVLNELQREMVSYDIGARDCAPVLCHALGLAGECGEVIEPIKKSYRDGTKLDLTHLSEELGDVIWYVCALADDHGIKLSDIFFNTLAKLQERRRVNVAKGIKDRRS